MKSLKTILSTLLLATVITGCSQRIQQPLLSPEFNSLDVNSSQVRADITPKRSDYKKQNVSIKMDEFSPIPKQGMKWTYNFDINYGDYGIGGIFDISIDKVTNTSVNVTVEEKKLKFARESFWYDFNLYLTREYHNKTFADYSDNSMDGAYAIYLTCNTDPNDPNSCLSEVEIPYGKFLVYKAMIQEYDIMSDPNSGNNELTWATSHFWINKKVGLVEMKLQSTKQPNLGITTLTLVKTNIK